MNESELNLFLKFLSVLLFLSCEFANADPQLFPTEREVQRGELEVGLSIETTGRAGKDLEWWMHFGAGLIRYQIHMY